MAEDIDKLVAAYLTLWKALDIYFPGHCLLEISDESLDNITEELEELARDDLAAWASDPKQLREEIESTIRRGNERNKDQNWYNEARIIKESFQDKALMYASRLPDPPPLSITAEAGA